MNNIRIEYHRIKFRPCACSAFDKEVVPVKVQKVALTIINSYQCEIILSPKAVIILSIFYLLLLLIKFVCYILLWPFQNVKGI